MKLTKGIGEVEGAVQRFPIQTRLRGEAIGGEQLIENGAVIGWCRHERIAWCEKTSAAPALGARCSIGMGAEQVANLRFKGSELLNRLRPVQPHQRL